MRNTRTKLEHRKLMRMFRNQFFDPIYALLSLMKCQKIINVSEQMRESKRLRRRG